MTAVQTIERVLKSKILKESLTYVPGRGVTSQELMELSNKLPRTLSEAQLSLLKRWNGLNLDVVRVYGASPTDGELRGLSEVQSGPLSEISGNVIFADDPSGFVYAETSTGEIISFDSSFGEVKTIAASLDDFFDRLVFGKDADQFAGKDWLSDLRDAGLV